MKATVALQVRETSTLSKAEAFPRAFDASRRIYTYQDAVEILNETKKSGIEKPLAAGVYYYDDSDRVGVDSGFWNGYRARVVQVDEAGNLSLSKKTVTSTDPKEVADAVDKGHRLADATFLANVQMIDQLYAEAKKRPGEYIIVVFGSGNAGALSKEDFREGWYVNPPEQDRAQKPIVADPEVTANTLRDALRREEEILAKERGSAAQREQRITEIKQLLESAEATAKKAKALEERTATEKKVLDEEARQQAEKAAQLIRNS